MDRYILQVTCSPDKRTLTEIAEDTREKIKGCGPTPLYLVGAYDGCATATWVVQMSPPDTVTLIKFRLSGITVVENTSLSWRERFRHEVVEAIRYHISNIENSKLDDVDMDFMNLLKQVLEYKQS